MDRDRGADPPSSDEARRGSFVHDAVYRVRFDEAGPDGLLRTSALMRYAQDLAWLHSTALGFGREWYAERGLTWLVRAADLRVLAPIPMGTTIAARTEVVAMRRVFARRRGTFRLPDGSLASTVDTDWVLIDARGALTRIPPVFREMFGAADGEGSIGRVPLPPAPPSASSLELTVRPHELDPMDHANNAIYLDWLEEAIVAGESDDDGGRARSRGRVAIAAIPRRYRLEYVRAAAASTAIRAEAWHDADRWAVRLVDASDGGDLFRATLDEEPVDRAAVSE